MPTMQAQPMAPQAAPTPQGGGWQDRLRATQPQQPPKQAQPAPAIGGPGNMPQVPQYGGPNKSPPPRPMPGSGQPTPMQPPKAKPKFGQHMRDMRKNYRGGMQAAGLNPAQIRQKMQAMRKHQRVNRSEYANQYMQRRTQPPQPMRDNRMAPAPLRQAPQPMRDNPMAPAPAPANRWAGNPLQAAPQAPTVQPGQMDERFNDRGRPTPSRANLMPQQMKGSWAQRMSGGMRGAPSNAPMPKV